MTRWELGEALGVKIFQKSSIKDQIVNGTERLPGWCENLVHIEAGDETVRFFHHSIKTYLLDMKLKTTEFEAFHIDLKAWDHRVGEICLTYLHFSDFEKALIEFSPDNQKLPSASKLYGQQIATSNEGRSIPAAVGNQAILNALPDTRSRLAVRFLRRFLKPKKSGFSLQVPQGTSDPTEPLSEVGPDFSEFFSHYPFLLYATNFWFHHSFHFSHSQTRTWTLWQSQVSKSMFEESPVWTTFGQEPPGFREFNPKNWLSNDRETAEMITIHKAMIFADFIAHRALLTYVLKIIKNRRHRLNPDILEQLLPTRRVFRFPLQREGYVHDEDSHAGLISLITEYIACGGPTDMCSSLLEPFSCNDTCRGKPMHMHVANLLSESKYLTADQPWLHLFAKMSILGLTEETLNDVKNWIDSGQPCIHEVRLQCGRDITDFILDIGEPSSSKFAHRVLELHKSCVGGRKYRSDYWRHKLHVAIENRDMDAVESYLRESKVSLEREKECCWIDYTLLREISDGCYLSPDFRSQAVSVAIPGVAEEEPWRVYGEFEHRIISGDWDIARALSDHGVKLADSMARDCARRSCFHVLDDVLGCVSQSAAPCCTQGWVISENETKPTLELCARHRSEAELAWLSPYRPEQSNDERIFRSLYHLVYPASPSMS